MPSEDHGSASFHFSTRSLSRAKRLPALREHFDRAVRLQIDTEPGHPVEMAMHLAPGLRRARMISPLTACMTRPASMLGDGEDTVCLMVKTSGNMAVAQRNRSGVPQEGDGVLLVYREPAQLQFVDATYLSVRVPFAALAGMADVGAAAGGLVPRGTEALRLLVSYVAQLPGHFDDPGLARLAATHVYDLLALALHATPEARETALLRGVRAARLKAVQADLTEDPTLSLEALARRQRVTPRYVQLLFEDAGTTFTRFAQDVRLAGAQRLLTNPRYAGWSITDVALEAGFGDISHFNRLFKQRYQMTPSDMRGASGRLPD